MEGRDHQWTTQEVMRVGDSSFHNILSQDLCLSKLGLRALSLSPARLGQPKNSVQQPLCGRTHPNTPTPAPIPLGDRSQRNAKHFSYARYLECWWCQTGYGCVWLLGWKTWGTQCEVGPLPCFLQGNRTCSEEETARRLDVNPGRPISQADPPVLWTSSVVLCNSQNNHKGRCLFMVNKALTLCTVDNGTHTKGYFRAIRGLLANFKTACIP